MLTNLARNLRNRQHELASILPLRRNLTIRVEPTTHSPVLTADELLSDANREKCIKCMQTAPPMSKYLQYYSRKQNTNSKTAAVLIAICINVQGEASILYTRRSGKLRSHVRQISFPGGIKDSTDVDYIDCALRETEEEIGLPRSRVEIWGTGQLLMPPRTASIMPVIGIVRDFDLDDLQLNEDEVEEAFTVPLTKLAEPSSLFYTQFKSGFSAPTFVVDENKIWGITGFLTYSFMNCLLPKDLNRLKNRVKFVKPFKTN